MPQIYLDCDGVLADFDRGARDLLGMSPKAFQARHGLKAFWRAIARSGDFFASLPPMPDALELYAAVRQQHPVILTGVPRGDWAEPQKRRWAAIHFPGVPLIATSAAQKAEHCHPGDALVDDTPRYRERWEDAGGVFILHRSAVQSIAELRRRGFLDAPLRRAS